MNQSRARAVARDRKEVDRRKPLGWLVIAALILLGMLSIAYAADEQAEADAPAPSTSNPLEALEFAVDRMIFFETMEDWVSGEASNVAMNTEDGILTLADPRERGFPRGSWTSPEIETEFAFTELIPSWNAHTPAETGVFFRGRVRDSETGEWSPWLFFGEWGKLAIRPNVRTVRFDGGTVHVDVLKLTSPADAFQLEANFRAYTFGEAPMPTLRRMAASYSGDVEDEELRERLATRVEVPEDWARSLDVPFIAQGSGPPEIRGSICSPTSVSMVMGYWGEERDFVQNAMEAYDPNYAIFGNWVRSTQLASQYGLDSWVTRMRSYDDVKAWIASGVPVIASIRFREGEFPSNVLERTNGHLIVIRGFTEDGDVIVNDPGSIERGEAVVYNADELANAWFAKGGVAYIIKSPDHDDIPETISVAMSGE